MKTQLYINADCLPEIKKLPDKYFDLAIVDPPYGINATKMSMGTNKTRSKNGYPSESTAKRIRKGRLNSGAGKLKNRALNTLNCDWDFEKPTAEYFQQLFRVTKNQIIMGGNYFELPPTRGFVIWDKLQPWDNFSQVEFIWTSFDCPAKLFRYSNTGGKNAEIKIHATQKPIELYEWLIAKFAKQGDIILDTHVGSASSLIACYNLGFEFIGYEKDEEIYKNSLERLKKSMEQITWHNANESEFYQMELY